MAKCRFCKYPIISSFKPCGFKKYNCYKCTNCNEKWAVFKELCEQQLRIIGCACGTNTQDCNLNHDKHITVEYCDECNSDSE